MTPEEVVNNFCAALNRSIDESLQYIDADCVYQNMPFDPVYGPQGVKDTLSGFFEVVGHVRIETLKQSATGNLVLNEPIREDWDGWIVTREREEQQKKEAWFPRQ